MKVLMPAMHYHPVIGGLETWIRNIAERTALQAEVFVVTGRVKDCPVREKKRGVNILRTSLVSLKNLSFSSFFYLASSWPFIFLKSWALVKKEKINLCHCHGFLSSLMGYLLLKLTNTPYIVTVQRLEEDKGFLRRLAYSHAELCIGSSRAVEKYFQKLIVKETKIIPNGIDLEKFKGLDRRESRRLLGLNNEFVIMTVARLEKVKGIEYLIRALYLLEAKMDRPSSGFKLLIIGEGSQREKLQALVKKLGLNPRVKFLGQVSNQDVPKKLKAADCFVLSSLKEGFGIAVLEAMASSVPVVATGVGGILDIIKDSQNGLLVSPEDPKEIAEAVYKIYSQFDLAERLVASAKQGLLRYDWDNISSAVYNLYCRYL